MAPFSAVAAWLACGLVCAVLRGFVNGYISGQNTPVAHDLLTVALGPIWLIPVLVNFASCLGSALARAVGLRP